MELFVVRVLKWIASGRVALHNVPIVMKPSISVLVQNQNQTNVNGFYAFVRIATTMFASTVTIGFVLSSHAKIGNTSVRIAVKITAFVKFAMTIHATHAWKCVWGVIQLIVKNAFSLTIPKRIYTPLWKRKQCVVSTFPTSFVCLVGCKP
jgi:hypothetical protein